MKTLTVYINNEFYYCELFKYIWAQFCLNKGVEFKWVNESVSADVILNDQTSNKIYPLFLDNFTKLTPLTASQWQEFFNAPVASLPDGMPDFWFTAFYLLNALQELNSVHEDELGRYTYETSYQKHFNNVTQNIVQECFDEIALRSPILENNITKKRRQSGFLLTHDIDSIYNGWKEDGKFVIKKGRLLTFMSMLIQAAIGKPHWFNIDKILALEKNYGFHSAFYWIVEKGKTKGLPNADYELNSSTLKKALSSVEKAGGSNGLHKSLDRKSLNEEWNKFTRIWPGALGNRYHFLKFKWTEACDEIEKAGVKFDTSLGFAETIGFRNSYGLPYQPFDLINNRMCDFVEAPLSVMDRTIHRYMKMSADTAADSVIEFFEKNNSNAVFSILWHNAFIENYKFHGFPKLYMKLLQYFYDSNFICYSENDLVGLFSISKIKQ